MLEKALLMTLPYVARKITRRGACFYPNFYGDYIQYNNILDFATYSFEADKKLYINLSHRIKPNFIIVVLDVPPSPLLPIS
jgi:hypothetical protein